METDKLQETILSEEDCGLLINLPQEIIVEILLRLPVKSVLKFRCVSKSWLSLLSSSLFIKNHLKISTCGSKVSHHRLLLGPYGSPAKCSSYSLYSILHEKSTVNGIELVPPHQDPCNKGYFVGNCNGLFCLLERSRSLFDHSHMFILWNPMTRKSKKLPNWGADYGSVPTNGSYFTYGFGYDEFNDDYKVVKISCFRGSDLRFKNKVNVYSLRRNSWRKTEDYQGGNLANQSGVFFDGALHWGVVNCENTPVSRSIVSFSLAEEKYEEKPLQCFKSYNLGSGIRVLKEYLAFYDYDEVEMEVWVLKEYGVNESWTKLFTIPFHLHFSDWISPIFVIEDDKILLKCGRSLMLFNSQDNTFKHAKLHAPGNWPQVAATTYFESLVSLDSYYEVGN